MKFVAVVPSRPLDPQVDPRQLTLLADVWGFVRPGLEQVLREQELELLPEHVFTTLASGGAQLFLLRDEALEDRGFVIVQRQIDIDSTATLLVWFMWSEPDALRKDWTTHDVQRALDELARYACCKRLRMQSNRIGWRRLGWAPKCFLYERGVE